MYFLFMGNLRGPHIIHNRPSVPNPNS
jgi:hypothetical protein